MNIEQHHSTAKKKKGKKKDRKENMSETAQELQNGDNFTEKVERKKKKRVKENADEDSCQANMLSDGKDENTKKKKRKRKKKQDQDCMEVKNGKYETQQLDCDEVIEETSRSKKKKQDSNDCDEVIEETSRSKKKKQDSNDCDEVIEETSRSKKKKKKQDSNDCDEVIEETSRSKKKKKKQDLNDCDDGCLEEVKDFHLQKQIKKKNRVKEEKKNEKSTNSEDILKEIEIDTPNAKDNQVIDNNETSVQDSSNAEIGGKKKKKQRTKSDKSKEDESALNHLSNSTDQLGQEPEDNEKRIKKKRKKNLVKESEEQNCDIQIEKKKKREDSYSKDTLLVNDTGKSKSARDSMNAKTKECWNDPVFASDERQEKFQRLLGGKKWSDKKKIFPCSIDSIKPENEKDKEEINSQSKNNSEEKDCSSPTLSAGQWKGMMFENVDRQNKFIRLLGGAKSNADKKKTLFSSGSSGPQKGLYGSLTSKFTTSLSDNGSMPGNNSAMDLQTAVSLNQNLEDDYNRALSKKLGGLGSAGIGFVKDPAEGKKFHIDSNATKSTKFSDDDE